MYVKTRQVGQGALNQRQRDSLVEVGCVCFS